MHQWVLNRFIMPQLIGIEVLLQFTHQLIFPWRIILNITQWDHHLHTIVVKALVHHLMFQDNLWLLLLWGRCHIRQWTKVRLVQLPLRLHRHQPPLKISQRVLKDDRLQDISVLIVERVTLPFRGCPNTDSFTALPGKVQGNHSLANTARKFMFLWELWRCTSEPILFLASVTCVEKLFRVHGFYKDTSEPILEKNLSLANTATELSQTDQIFELISKLTQMSRNTPALPAVKPSQECHY